MYVTQLKDIIDQDAEEEFKGIAQSFCCKDKDVENFLKTKAFEYERRKKSRTYIVFDDGAGGSPLRVAAYFTLSIKILTFGPSVSKTSVREIDGFNKKATAVSALLIGQFGKNENIERNIGGDRLLEMCLNRLGTVQDSIGGRIVLAECLPIDPVVKFYTQNGFKFLQTDENDKYQQMILAI